MNKMGIYYAFWEQEWECDYTKYVHKVADLGFDVLEVAVGSLVGKNPRDLDRLKETAKERNIDLTYCIGFQHEYDIASADIKIRKAGIEFSKKILEVIHYMGGEILGGITYSSWPGTLNYGLMDKSEIVKRSLDSIGKLMEIAEEYNIIYCFEVVNRFEQYIMNTAKEAVDYVKAIGSENAKILLDTFHMNIEEDSIGDAIRYAGNYLGHLHIGECNRKVPGRGHMPWEEISKALKDINYKGRIVMEPFLKMGGSVGRDIKVWRDLSQEMDEMEMDNEAKFGLDFIKEILK